MRNHVRMINDIEKNAHDKMLIIPTLFIYNEIYPQYTICVFFVVLYILQNKHMSFFSTVAF